MKNLCNPLIRSIRDSDNYELRITELSSEKSV